MHCDDACDGLRRGSYHVCVRLSHILLNLQIRATLTKKTVFFPFFSFTGPWLGLSPSFVFSPVVPGLYAILTVLVELAPRVPEMSLLTELPLSFMDGLTRAFLLCQLIPPVVTAHAQRAIADSPWTLLLASLVRVCSFV